MRITPLALLLPVFLAATAARADLRITRDHGGYVEQYKAKYERIRNRHERVIIDGIAIRPAPWFSGSSPSTKSA